MLKPKLLCSSLRSLNTVQVNSPAWLWCDMVLLWVGNIDHLKASDGGSLDLMWCYWPALEQSKCHLGEEASLTTFFLSLLVFPSLFLPICAAESMWTVFSLQKIVLFWTQNKEKAYIPADTSCLENTPTSLLIFDCFPYNIAQLFLLTAFHF